MPLLPIPPSAPVPGPQGPAGALVVNYVEFSGAASGQTVVLGAVAGSFKLLVVNSHIEFPDNYSVSGSSLTIPPGLVWDGASCLFIFSVAGIGSGTIPAPVVKEFAITNPNQIFTFPESIGIALGFYADGLRQPRSSFSCAGNTLTLTGDYTGSSGVFEYFQS